MEIFVAYPYALDKARRYRERLVRAFASASEVTLTFADEHLSNKHVLDKIRDMMEAADLILFDLTDANPNVTLELGIAIAAGHPYIVAIREDAISKLNSDIHGWDQLRYSDEQGLATALLDRIEQGRVPRREVGLIELSAKMFETIGFGLRTSATDDRSEIGIALRPIARTPVRLEGLLDDPGVARRPLTDLFDSVINLEQARNFWAGGLGLRAREDHLELTSADEEGMRIYRDGTIAYYRSVQSSKPVALRPAILEELSRMSMLLAREIYVFFRVNVRRIAIMATLRPTSLFVIDQSSRNFRPHNYRGDSFIEGTPSVLHIPSTPAIVDIGDGKSAILAASREIQRILATHVPDYRR